MAALVQTKAANSSSSPASLSATFDSSVTTGNLVAVTVRLCSVSAGDASTRTVTVTDSESNTYTLAVASPAMAADINAVRIYYAKNVTGGASFQVTATITGSAAGRAEILAHEVSGLDATAPDENTASATANSSAPSGGSVTTAGGGFVIAAAQTMNGYRTMSAGSGFTFITPANIWGTCGFQHRAVTSGGSYDGAFGMSGGADEWTAVVAAFKDSAGGGGGSSAGAAAHYYRQMQ